MFNLNSNIESINWENVFTLIGNTHTAPKSADEIKKLFLQGNLNQNNMFGNAGLSKLIQEEALIAAKEIVNSSGAPLIAKGQPITARYIEKIVDLQLNCNDSIIIETQSNERLIHYFKDEVVGKMTQVVDDLKSTTNPGAALFQKVWEKTKGIDSVIEKSYEHLLNSPQQTLHLSKAFNNKDSSILEKSVGCGLIALSILSQFKKTLGDERTLKEHAILLYKSALLRDISMMLDKNNSETEHAQDSYEIVKKLKYNADVAEAIREHHTIFDDAKQPIYVNGQISFYGSILVVADSFMEMMADRELGRDELDVVRTMTSMADHGMLHKECVEKLSHIYLPSKREYILKKALEIVASCPKARLWTVGGGQGDPIKIICNHDCDFLNRQIPTQIFHDVNLSYHGNNFKTPLTEGTYFTCNHLSDLLKEYIEKAENDIN